MINVPFSILHLSLPLRLALTAALNSVLAWGLDTYLPESITFFGGAAAFVITGSLFTLLNLFLRPLLQIVTFPLHLLFTLFTTIAVNVFFLWVVYQIALKMDPAIIAITITGGLSAWVTLGMTIGVANWLMKHVL